MMGCSKDNQLVAICIEFFDPGAQVNLNHLSLAGFYLLLDLLDCFS